MSAVVLEQENHEAATAMTRLLLERGADVNAVYEVRSHLHDAQVTRSRAAISHILQ